jgi:two-component system, LytTR family, sensor kinase
MQYKSLLYNQPVRIWIAVLVGILFKFPTDIILSVSYRNHSMFRHFPDYLVFILFSVILFHILQGIDSKLDKKYNWDKLPRQRFWLQLLIHLMVAMIIILPAKYYFSHLLYRPVFYVIKFEIIGFLILIFVIFSFNLVELAYYLIQKWRFSLAELERFKKENAESRFETLMNQVNPHFLFNSLNTLSSLVYENQDTAAKYIRELSKVYRYVLENKENELVLLKDDLEFVKSYVYLFELRFANMISFDFDISENSQQKLIAPMTIQLLIENAVKHNIISKKKNFTVKIFTENDFLVVSNKLQKKTEKPDSTGMGLQNIKSRYAYLCDKDVLIHETAEEFIVKIPLIQSNKQGYQNKMTEKQ